MQDVRSKFPVLQNYIYANTASSGLPYSDLMEWRTEHDRLFFNGGSLMRDGAHELITKTREAVARFFNCKYDNVALLQNFSLGLNMLLEGLGDSERILFLENDYPSVSWTFEKRGFKSSFVKIDGSLEHQISEKIEKEGISILALSLVQWLNGIKIDLEFLKNLKAKHPELLIIADGTQFCGTEIFDFEDSAIDVLGASCYKWLLSGYGNGFMLFKDKVKARVDIKTIGFNAANAQLAKKNEVRFAKRFEPGHLDTLNFGSLMFSLNFFEELGKENIERKLKKLAGKAKNELGDLGLLEEVVMKSKDHSTIFNIKGDESLFNKLVEQKIVASLRGNGIRLSFHFYNTINEIEAIVKVLKTAL